MKQQAPLLCRVPNKCSPILLGSASLSVASRGFQTRHACVESRVQMPSAGQMYMNTKCCVINSSEPDRSRLPMHELGLPKVWVCLDSVLESITTYASS